MQQLINYIERFVRLDSEAISALENLAEIETFKKNQFILEQGVISKLKITSFSFSTTGS